MLYFPSQFCNVLEENGITEYRISNRNTTKQIIFFLDNKASKDY